MTKFMHAALVAALVLVAIPAFGQETIRTIPLEPYHGTKAISSATWPADRIDQRTLPMDGLYDDGGRTGSGVYVLVFDTGVDREALAGFDIADGFDGIAGSGRVEGDCSDNKHGTAVISTLLSVARNVTVVPVRVLDCDGSSNAAAFAAGLQWSINKFGGMPNVVVNLSMRFDSNSSLMDKFLVAGILPVTGAGNDGDPTCATATSDFLIVGGSSLDDEEVQDIRWTSSNYGSCVEIHAPAEGIPTAVGVWTGTSLSVPLVSGAAALLLGEEPNTSPEDLKAALVEGATENAMMGVPSGTPNRLVYSLVEMQSPSPGGCQEGFTTACIGAGGRFAVSVRWSSLPDFGERPALVSDLGTEQSAIFFFLDDRNLEFLVKVVDGCGFNDHHWVFFAATTNVAFTMTVTDTVTGQTKLYTNEQGHPANAVTDTEAFATC